MGSWKVVEKSWIFVSKRLGTLCAEMIACVCIVVYDAVDRQ